MAFHVEIRHGRRWAREFNLDAERLRNEILAPWTEDRVVHLGDRDWEPAECRLQILEGPELSGPDLAFSRGWDRAERSSKSVTGELVAGAAREAQTIAVLAETEPARDAVMGALRELGVRAVDWPLTDADRSARHLVALVLAVETSDPPRAWLFEAGGALSAVGGRALVVRLADADAPAELASLPSVEAGEELAPALEEALGRLGPE